MRYRERSLRSVTFLVGFGLLVALTASSFAQTATQDNRVLRPDRVFPSLDLTRLFYNAGLGRRLAGHNPDLVVGFDFDGCLLGTGASRAPYVVALKGVMADEVRFETGASLRRFQLLAPLEARNARSADAVICTSVYSARQATRAYGIPAGRTRVVPEGIDVSPSRVEPGDAILLSGDLGRHGMAVMSVREGLEFEGALESDCASLAGLVEAMLAAGGDVHCLRDLTRGGLAAALNEIARHAQVGIELEEAAIAVAEPVAGACELLGLDPLYVANEGRLVAFVPAEAAEEVLEIMRSHRAAPAPAVIGAVVEAHAGTVELRGLLGGGRIIDLLTGEQMPRIC